ncbi:hypothetical protein [Kitasatospora griseola]|uniref:hypothetical protein n=1 Tax=Kitasatospora griseola TaxID=2064 RepID=UPI0038212F00
MVATAARNDRPTPLVACPGRARLLRTPMGHAWHDLPSELRTGIEERIGPVARATPPAAGTVSDFSALLDAADGPAFCKAVREDNAKAWMHRLESAVNSVLPPGIGPRLLWTVEAAGWLALGFERAPGRHADLSPGSADLPLVARTLETLAETLTPAPPLRTLRLADRWSGQRFWCTLGERHRDRLDPWVVEHLDTLAFAEREAPGLIDGNTLVHTDLTGPNLLVEGSTVQVVDWAFPAPGAAWVDTAYLVIRLIQTGHTPQEAERWADSVSMWRAASPWAITTFVAALAGLWTLRADALGAHGLAWLRHRLG